MRFGIELPERVARRYRIFVAFFVGFFSFLAVVRLALRGDSPWQQGDWLINYSAGFVRRGLLGHGLLSLSDTTNINPSHLLFALQAILFSALVVGAIFLGFQAKPVFGVLLLLVSPAFLLFPLWDPNGGFRKELAGLAIFAWLLVWSLRDFSTRAFERKLYGLAWILFPPSLVMVHEGLFFVIPILLAPFVLLEERIGNASWKTVLILGVSLLLSVFALVASVLSPGNENQARGICDSLIERGYTSDICDGAVNALTWDLNAGVAVVRDAASLWFLPAMILAAAPFFLFRYSRPLGLAMVFGLISLLPLFVVGADWGRWLHIAVAATSLTIIRLIGTSGARSFVERRRFSASEPIGAALLVLYGLGWHLPHYSPSNILPGIVDIIQKLV